MALSVHSAIQVVVASALWVTAMLWCAALAAIVVVAGLALMLLRRRLLRDEREAAGALMPLHELRTLHARGELSDEEFEALKGALLRTAGGAGGRAAPRVDRPLAAGERRAEPGFDLAGDPLPRPETGADEAGGERKGSGT